MANLSKQYELKHPEEPDSSTPATAPDPDTGYDDTPADYDDLPADDEPTTILSPDEIPAE